MFTFLSPLLLIGAVSAVIPLLIHLSRSRRTKKMRFSTTRFFTDQFLRSYRMSRLKELLLLAFRMALCALFAVALAGPMLSPGGGSPVAGRTRAAVLVLDNSASMSLEDDGQTVFERARRAAGEVLDGLGDGDAASLVLAGRRAAGPEIVFPQPTPQLGDVRQALDGLQPATLGTDLSAAVRQARTIAARSAADSKEIYVFSDLQAAGCTLADDGPTGAESDTLVFFVSIRPEQPQNLAITAVQYAAARPTVGLPFSIRPHLRNQSQQPRRVAVRLVVDGELVAERQVESLPGGRWTVPRLHHAFEQGGWHEGFVEIADGEIADGELSDDPLAADNRRWFAFEVVASLRVLAINGAPSQVPRLDELFFLKTALAAAAGAKSAIELDSAPPDALATAELTNYQVIVLANVETLPALGIDQLESFVDRGGSLLMFLGDRTSQPFFNPSLAGETRLHGGLSPGRLLGVERQPSGEGAVAHVGDIDTDHPALAGFDDPRFASLSSVELRALWTIEPAESRVLMRADSGSPLLVEKEYGQGRVMLFASTCDRDWTNFPVRPAYLPWVYRLVTYLAQQPLVQQGFYHTGDLVPLTASAEEGLGQVLVKTPDGSLQPAVPSDEPRTPLVFTDTEQVGVYRVATVGKQDAGGRFAANLESYESDLTYLDEAGLRERFGHSPTITYVADPRQVSEASGVARRGVPLWDLALWIALAVALVEPWLANRISLRHYGRPAAGILPERG